MNPSEQESKRERESKRIEKSKMEQPKAKRQKQTEKQANPYSHALTDVCAHLLIKASAASSSTHQELPLRFSANSLVLSKASHLYEMAYDFMTGIAAIEQCDHSSVRFSVNQETISYAMCAWDVSSDLIVKVLKVLSGDGTGDDDDNDNDEEVLKLITGSKDGIKLVLRLKDNILQYCMTSRDASVLRSVKKVKEMPNATAVASYKVWLGAKGDAAVRARCKELCIQLVEEYDFRSDLAARSLDVAMKPGVELRTHQKKSLQRMFGNGHAKSGIIVLPCGSGKSLVGAAAAVHIGKSCLCVCTSTLAAQGWKHEFMKWTTLGESQVVCITSNTKDELKATNDKPCICITTYAMLSTDKGDKGDKGEHARSTEFINAVKHRTWGLLLLDEVHVAPADQFQKVVDITDARCKLGLTATLVREDDKIDNLRQLVGPTLYEANWLDLEAQGFIAKLECLEVSCDMVDEFGSAYAEEGICESKRLLLQTLNPNKFVACMHLVRKHERQGDKVIVFCDNIFALNAYAKDLQRFMMDGNTGDLSNASMLAAFKKDSSTVNTILMSKVGDNSIDLPDATVMIQINSHGGSRRQEAQRIGRLLRSGSGRNVKKSVRAYTLLSAATREVEFQERRQEFIAKQGYVCEKVTDADIYAKDGISAADVYKDYLTPERIQSTLDAINEHTDR